MKFAIRKISIKRCVAARTTGRVKRVLNKVIIPGYGKKRMGSIKNPKRVAYNRVYNKTTFNIWDLFKK